MSDDTKTSTARLSTPQATANLDDVLASLEKQTGSTPDPLTKPAEAATPFSINESRMDPNPRVLAPAAEPLPSMEHVQDQPLMQTQSPILGEPISPIPNQTSNASPQKGLFGFTFSPKFIGAALGVALMAVGAVGAYVAFQSPEGSVDTRQKASACTITYSGNSFTTQNCTNAGTITVWNGPSCPTTDTKVSQYRIQTDGTFSPQPPVGKCQQIDHDFGGVGAGPGGVCSCNFPPDNICPLLKINPSTLSVGIGETKTIEVQLKQGSFSKLNVAISPGANLIAQVTPLSFGPSTLPYDAKATDIELRTLTVKGLKAGSGYFSVDSTDTFAGYEILRCSAGFTINVAGSSPTPTPTPSPTPSPTPTATPTPTPSPTPTPTPTPPPLVCLNITKNVANPVVGSEVRFTCGQVAGATAYEFRYKYTFNGAAPVGGTLSSNGNVSAPLVISQSAIYKAQCRPCVGSACTAWETW